MALTGVTVTVAVPVAVLVCDDMAVTVTGVLTLTACAVNRPVESTVPALAAQVTAVVKEPVPTTVAVHWLVWPDWIDVGVQETVTDVTVAVLDPPPQAAMPKSATNVTIKARTRKPSPRRP